jgi:CheY-like chemotaxis protein
MGVYLHSPRPIRILYVEDDPWAVANVPELLQPLHCIIDNELDGQLAFDKLERGEHRADIVLTDLLHPGLNGWELCEHLKRSERLRHVPVVFFSRQANWFFARRAVTRGADVAIPCTAPRASGGLQRGMASDDLLRLIVEVTVLGPRPPLVKRLLELRDDFFCTDAWLRAATSAN